MASGGGPQDGDEGSTEVSLAHLNALLVSMTTAVNRLDAGLPLHTTTMPRSGETQTAGSAHGAAETQLPPPTVPGSSSSQWPDAPQAAPASSPSGLAPPGSSSAPAITTTPPAALEPGQSLTAILLAKKAEAIAQLAAKQAAAGAASPSPARTAALDRLAKYKRREQHLQAKVVAAAAESASSPRNSGGASVTGEGSPSGSQRKSSFSGPLEGGPTPPPSALSESDPTAALSWAIKQLVPPELLEQVASASATTLAAPSSMGMDPSELADLLERRLSEASADVMAALQVVPAPELPRLPQHIADLLAQNMVNMSLLASCDPLGTSTPSTLPTADALAQSLSTALGIHGGLDMAALERYVVGTDMYTAAPQQPTLVLRAAEQTAAASQPALDSSTSNGIHASAAPPGEIPTVLAGTMSGRVLVWPIDRADPDAVLSGDSDELASITVLQALRNGGRMAQHIVSANEEGSIQVWKKREVDNFWIRGLALGAHAAHFGSVNALADVLVAPPTSAQSTSDSASSSTPSSMVLSCGADGAVRLWCPITGACILAPARHDGGATSAAGLATGKCVTGGNDSTLRFWDIAPRSDAGNGEAPASSAPSSQQLGYVFTQRVAVKTDAPITSIAALPGGRCASGDSQTRDQGGCNITLWTALGEKERTVVVPAHVTCLCLLPPAHAALIPGTEPLPRLAFGCQDGSLGVINAEARVNQETAAVPPLVARVTAPAVCVKAHNTRLKSLACAPLVLPNVGIALLSVAADGTAVVWAVSTGKTPAMAKWRVLATPAGTGTLTYGTIC